MIHLSIVLASCELYSWKLQPVAFISAFSLSEKWKNILFKLMCENKYGMITVSSNALKGNVNISINKY